MRWLPYWALLPLRRYAVLSGRSRRREFWSFIIFTMVAGVLLELLDGRLGLQDERATWALGAGGVLSAVFTLATLVPTVTVSVRRLHDIGRSGWWLVPGTAAMVASALAFVQLAEVQDFQGVEVEALVAFGALLVSAVVMLILFSLDGTPGSNRFGGDPKGVSFEGVFD